MHARRMLKKAKEIASKAEWGKWLYTCSAFKKATYLICVKEIPAFFSWRILSVKNSCYPQILQCWFVSKCLIPQKIKNSRDNFIIINKHTENGITS